MIECADSALMSSAGRRFSDAEMTDAELNDAPSASPWKTKPGSSTPRSLNVNSAFEFDDSDVSSLTVPANGASLSVTASSGTTTAATPAVGNSHKRKEAPAPDLLLSSPTESLAAAKPKPAAPAKKKARTTNEAAAKSAPEAAEGTVKAAPSKSKVGRQLGAFAQFTRQKTAGRKAGSKQLQQDAMSSLAKDWKQLPVGDKKVLASNSSITSLTCFGFIGVQSGCNQTGRLVVGSAAALFRSLCCRPFGRANGTSAACSIITVPRTAVLRRCPRSAVAAS